MTTLTDQTFLRFTEIKNGSVRSKTFETTAGSYIAAVRDDSPNAFEEYLERAYDADKEPQFIDTFETLSIEDQLDACIDSNNDCNASNTTWELAD